MNLSSGHTAFPTGKHTTSGAGGTLGGAANAGPAPLTVGAVGFWPNWTTEDSMAASIVRLENELTTARDTVLTLRRERAEQDALIEELRAEVALLREERAILERKFAGVIEGGQRSCNSEAYATPSDLSPRTTLEETVQEFREGLFFGEGKK